MPNLKWSEIDELIREENDELTEIELEHIEKQRKQEKLKKINKSRGRKVSTDSDKE